MNFIELIAANKLNDAKESITARLNELVSKRLAEAKRYIAAQVTEDLDEAITKKRNPNIIKMGRITKIRRRIRRNSKGRIIVQKNKRKAGIKGYRISGNTVRRIPATVRLHKARLMKRAWKTTRRAKLRRTLLKRKLSMRRRTSLGLR